MDPEFVRDLDAWLPKPGEVSDHFFGIDRATPAMRLSADYNPPKRSLSERIRDAIEAFKHGRM